MKPRRSEMRNKKAERRAAIVAGRAKRTGKGV